jgi:hypothetical protein
MPWMLKMISHDYEFSGPFAFLKHQLSDFVQVDYFDDWDAENEIE